MNDYQDLTKEPESYYIDVYVKNNSQSIKFDYFKGDLNIIKNGEYHYFYKLEDALNAFDNITSGFINSQITNPRLVHNSNIEVVLYKDNYVINDDEWEMEGSVPYKSKEIQW